MDDDILQWFLQFHNLFYIPLVLDCVPDPNSFEPGCETAVFAVQIQKILHEAKPVTSSREQVVEKYDEVQISAALQALELQIGDKVVVGGVKVRIHISIDVTVLLAPC